MDEERINLSRFVNENVLLMLSVDSEDDLIEKKSELDMKIKLLDKRMENLRALNLGGSKVENAKKQALAEFREAFSVRMENPKSREENLSWILASKNVGRSKILEKLPEQMLDELEAWYDGKEKSKHSEN